MAIMFVKVSLLYINHCVLVNTVERISQLSQCLPLDILLGDKRYGRTVLPILIQVAVLFTCGGTLYVSSCWYYSSSGSI